MSPLKAISGSIVAFAVLASAAEAKPNVQLKLDAAIVRHDAKGGEQRLPVAGVELKPGELLRYDIRAINRGTDPATKLVPVAKIPAGTTYALGTASADGKARAEFSLDGGKTWSPNPTVDVATPTGVVRKAADPATYTAIRWIGAKALAPSAAISYSYEVRVK